MRTGKHAFSTMHPLADSLFVTLHVNQVDTSLITRFQALDHLANDGAVIAFALAENKMPGALT